MLAVQAIGCAARPERAARFVPVLRTEASGVRPRLPAFHAGPGTRHPPSVVFAPPAVFLRLFVVLFVSDMHFGRAPVAPGASDESADRKQETELIECLKAHRDAVDHLYLVGDVFDCYVEYRHLVPKGFVRFQGLLARWTDAGIPVTYLVGNHDPWHRDYFRDELGVRVIRGAVDAAHYGRSVRLSHGDEVASTHRFYGALRDWMRHPVPIWLYRTLLPGDLGMGLARWASRALHEEAPDPEVVETLRRQARRRLREGGVDGVVMGHSHVPALHTWPEGTYLNTGNWFEARTLGRLDADGFHLLRWNGRRALPIESADFAPAGTASE